MASLNREHELTGGGLPPLAAAPHAETTRFPDLSLSPYFRWKGVLDRVLALLLLIPSFPLLLVLTWRPGIFRQVRVGKGGQRFTMYKIRTMHRDAESKTGAVWARQHDPRVSRVGRILRCMHLDELPQLINVLKGEMSLVGPRPERPEFVRVLSKKLPGYSQRLAVRPGITGLAQVNFPPDVTLGCVARKLVLDREYLERASLLFDLRLLLATLLRVLRIRAVHLLGLHRAPVIAPHAAHATEMSGFVSPIDISRTTSEPPGKVNGSEIPEAPAPVHDRAACSSRPKPR